MHRARDERKLGREGIKLLVQLPTRDGLAVGKHMLSRLERQVRAGQRIDGFFPIALAAEGDVLAGSLVGKVGFEQLARFDRAFAPVTRERLPHFLLDVSHRRGVRRHDGHPLAARHRHRDDAQDDLGLARARRPFDDGQREMERLVHGDALVAVERVRALREQALDQLPFGARLPRIEGRRVKDASDVGSEVRVEKRRVAIRSTSIQIVVDAVAKVPKQGVERLAIPVTVAPGRRIRTGLAGYPRGLFEVRKKPFARFSVFLPHSPSSPNSKSRDRPHRFRLRL